MYIKTRPTVIALAALFLSGCLQSTLHLPPDKTKLAMLEAGTLESSLRIIAGEPDRVLDSKKGYRTFYYRERLSSNCFKDVQACIPIIIESGKVAAVGHQWAKAWKQQHSRNAAFSSRKRGGSQTTLSAGLRQELVELEEKARAIPMSRTADNLMIYRYLLKLDPGNPRYAQKVAFYEDRFEKEKAQRVAAHKRLAARRKWQNTRLREFKGSRKVQMAAEILGNGKFYVWLKNSGKKPFRVAAEQFFLVCDEDRRFGIYSSKDFGRDLEPGATIEGRLTFNVSCDPRQIIYANPGMITVSRNIPVPEIPAEPLSASVR